MIIPEIVLQELERQEKFDHPGQHACRFVFLTRGQEARAGGLKTSEAKLYKRLKDTPQAMDTFLKGASEAGTLNRLVARGLAQVSGLTPSDAMHVLGLQDNWHGEAARKAAEISARIKNRFGQAIADSADALCRKIKDQLTVQSCDVILRTCSAEDGIEIGAQVPPHLLAVPLSVRPGSCNSIFRLTGLWLALELPLQPTIQLLGNALQRSVWFPGDADVANAIGAVASEVRVTLSITVSSNDGGNSISVLLPSGPRMFADEEKAMETARASVESEIRDMAEKAGADNPEFEVFIETDAPEIEGSRHFVQSRITMTATGRPKLDMKRSDGH